MIIIRIQESPVMYVCVCNPVTDSQIRGCVRRGACTLSDLQMELGVAVQCGQCASSALEILGEESTKAGWSSSAAGFAATDGHAGRPRTIAIHASSQSV